MDDYVSGAFNGENASAGSAEQVVMYALGTRMLVKVGTQLFRGVWGSCGKRWKPTGSPIELGEEDGEDERPQLQPNFGDALPIQANSPTRLYHNGFDALRLRAAGDRGPCDGHHNQRRTPTDPDDSPDDRQPRQTPPRRRQ